MHSNKVYYFYFNKENNKIVLISPKNRSTTWQGTDDCAIKLPPYKGLDKLQYAQDIFLELKFEKCVYECILACLVGGCS